MEFIVKSNQRWDNGSYYQVITFNNLALLFNGDEGEDVDDMFDAIASLNVNQIYVENFFGGNEYTFRRIS
jgi:hypothetical protein